MRAARHSLWDGARRKQVTKVATSQHGSPVTKRAFGLRQNVALNIGGKSFSILTSLFSAPFIVYHIGLRAFGVWALISAFSQYAGLLNFGVGTALTRYVAELHSVGDHESIARKGAAGFYITLGYAAVVMTAIGAFCIYVPHSVTDSWPHGWSGR